jgi:hypothetical protein
MSDDGWAYFRRQHRKEYLRRHAEARRAGAKRDGARRIDVTLQGDALDNFKRVKQWLDGNNRIGIERGFYNTPKTLSDGMVFTVPPRRLSDPEIIKTALMLATVAIEKEKNQD